MEDYHWISETVLDATTKYDKEIVSLTLGIRLVSTSPEVCQIWICDVLPSTTITYAWAGAEEVF